MKLWLRRTSSGLIWELEEIRHDDVGNTGDLRQVEGMRLLF